MTVNTTKSVHYIMTRGAGEWRRYSVNAIKIPPFIIYDARNTMPIDTPVYVISFPDLNWAGSSRKRRRWKSLRNCQCGKV